MLSPGRAHTEPPSYLAQMSHQLLLIQNLGGSPRPQGRVW